MEYLEVQIDEFCIFRTSSFGHVIVLLKILIVIVI